MARGVSLHVGINKVSFSAFSAQHLLGCENDAVAMSNIALQRGFTDVKLLLGSDATFSSVDAEVRRAAALLKAGDIFLFTFAGHGSRVANSIFDELLPAEPDGQDEAIVLFNRLMLDDYMRRVLWPEFKEGVRIVAVLDSCHSATAAFAAPDFFDAADHDSVVVADGAGVGTNAAGVHVVESVTGGAWAHATNELPPPAPDVVEVVEDAVVEIDGPRERAITETDRRRHRNDFQFFYDELEIPTLAAAPPVRASLLTLAACADGKTTQDGTPNGAFTAALLKVWDNGAFPGDYVTFRDKIEEEIRKTAELQTPALKTENAASLSGEQPFTI